GRQPGAVADVEPVNRLHQTADRFLEEVGIAEGMVPKAFGDVRGQADVGRRQPMLVVDVTVVDPANGDHLPGFLTAVIPDELRHRPGFQRGLMLAQSGEMPLEHTDQLALRLPESGKQFSFLFWRQEVRGKDRGGGNCNSILWRRLALTTFRLHSRPSLNKTDRFSSPRSNGESLLPAAPHGGSQTAPATRREREDYNGSPDTLSPFARLRF